jgi:hypothetical protein
MWNRRKSRLDLGNEIAQLRRDFDDVYQRVSNMRSPLSSPQGTMSRLMPWLDQGLAHAMPASMRGMGNAASRTASDMSSQAEEALHSAMRAVSRRPVPAAVALLVIGVAIGMAARKMTAD